MTTTPSRGTSAAPSVPVGLVAALAALGVLAVGWLAFALSEQTPDRVAGALLLVAGLLTAAAAGAALTRTRPAPVLLAAASGSLVLAGLAAGALTATGGRLFLADLVVLAGVPAVAGLVLAWASRRLRAR